MARARRTSPLLVTMAIVAILSGSLGLLCGCCGAADAAALMSSSAGSRELRDFLDDRAPAWVILVSVRGIAFVLLSALTLIAGIGLLMRQGWGRWLAVLAAAALIPVQLIYGIYGVGAYMPAMEQFVLHQQPNAPPGFSSGFRGGFLATFIPPVALSLFAAVVLIVGLMNGAASAALAPSPRTSRRPEDEDERPRSRRRLDDDD